jgi:hypothetical protein
LRKKKRKDGPSEEGKADWAQRRKGEGRRGFGVFLFKFFSKSFSNFTQTIKPCIRIMMHKHLLFLTSLK